MNLIHKLTILSSIILLLSLFACQNSQDGDVSLETDMQEVSYSYGFDVGKTLNQRGMSDLDYNTFRAGLMDGLQDNEPQLTQEERQQIIQEHGQQSADERRKMMNELAETNLQESQEFLEENKSKEGVKITDSGLQYKILEEGDGTSPDSNDEVTVHYEGQLKDGTVFDSSYERGQPATFPVDGVIQGWTQALQMMQEGAKYKLFIPPNLAYGERGAGQRIGPNEVLIFEVELLEVNPKE